MSNSFPRDKGQREVHPVLVLRWRLLVIVNIKKKKQQQINVSLILRSHAPPDHPFSQLQSSLLHDPLLLHKKVPLQGVLIGEKAI